MKRCLAEQVVLFALVGILVGILGWLMCLDMTQIGGHEDSYAPYELAEMRLSLNEINYEDFRLGGKDRKYPGNQLEVIHATESEVFEDVEIKGRGNSTWGAPKTPLQMKLSERADLLGLGAAKKWVLLANYFDASLMRNDVAFKLAEMLGEQYATRGEFVNFYVDDEYMGVYYLTHKVEISKGSVDLRDMYGVLMEVDSLHWETEECYFTHQKTCLVLKEAVTEDDEDIIEQAVVDFVDDYNLLEQLAVRHDFAAISELIDVKSFAEYYLMSEFTSNPDAYISSFYLYKNGERDVIHAGPVWDYDLALANREWIWGEGDEIYSPYAIMPFREDVMKREGYGVATKVFYHMIEMPEFKAEVEQVFREKWLGKKDELLKYIRWRRDAIREAALVDALKWERKDFDTEMAYLLDWVERRFNFLEYELAGTTD